MSGRLSSEVCWNRKVKIVRKKQRNKYLKKIQTQNSNASNENQSPTIWFSISKSKVAVP